MKVKDTVLAMLGFVLLGAEGARLKQREDAQSFLCINTGEIDPATTVFRLHACGLANEVDQLLGKTDGNGNAVLIGEDTLVCVDPREPREISGIFDRSCVHVLGKGEQAMVVLAEESPTEDFIVSLAGQKRQARVVAASLKTSPRSVIHGTHESTGLQSCAAVTVCAPYNEVISSESLFRFFRVNHEQLRQGFMAAGEFKPMVTELRQVNENEAVQKPLTTGPSVGFTAAA